MFRFSSRSSAVMAALIAAFMLTFFIGCGDDDDETPPPVNNLTGTWQGTYESTVETDDGTFNGYLLHDDSNISGYFVTNDEDTFTISSATFQDPDITVTAIDSNIAPPATMNAGGRLVTADSAVGTYHINWPAGDDEGDWYMSRDASD